MLSQKFASCLQNNSTGSGIDQREPPSFFVRSVCPLPILLEPTHQISTSNRPKQSTVKLSSQNPKKQPTRPPKSRDPGNEASTTLAYRLHTAQLLKFKNSQPKLSLSLALLSAAAFFGHSKKLAKKSCFFLFRSCFSCFTRTEKSILDIGLLFISKWYLC